jgi:hypothetical protein
VMIHQTSVVRRVAVGMEPKLNIVDWKTHPFCACCSQHFPEADDGQLGDPCPVCNWEVDVLDGRGYSDANHTTLRLARARWFRRATKRLGSTVPARTRKFWRNEYVLALLEIRDIIRAELSLPSSNPPEKP